MSITQRATIKSDPVVFLLSSGAAVAGSMFAALESQHVGFWVGMVVFSWVTFICVVCAVVKNAAASNRGGVQIAVGVWIALVGVATCIYGFAFFDVSISVQNGWRVVNVGKLSDRNAIMVIGAAAAICGVLMATLTKRGE